MSGSRFRALARQHFALAAALVLGCTAAPRVTASPEDYQGYRSIRLDDTFLGRLGAAWRYLRTQPEGAFRPEVERWFERADERYLVRHWDDMSNLERYAETLPDAPRTGLVRARMAALVALRERLSSERAAFLEQEAERGRQLDLAKQGRGEFIRTLLGWVNALVVSQDFGKPKQDWDRAFQDAYFGQAGARCEGEICRGSFLASFEIPRQRGLETRAVAYVVTARLDQGKLHTLELSGAQLFDRLAEAATARPSDPSDLQARAESIGVTVELLSMSLDAGFPGAACQEEAVSPVVLVRNCGGRAAYVIAAEDESQQDRVVIEIRRAAPGSVTDP